MAELDTLRRGHVPAPPVEELFGGFGGDPYLDVVPKDYDENLAYRADTLAAAEDDEGFQTYLWERCQEDILFWINSFVWLIEPRTGGILPFITYPFQDRCILELKASMGHHDVVLVKSRDMGGTWMVITAFTHEWQFFEHMEFGLSSRVENDVDTVGDCSTLLPKADFMLARQPAWLAGGSKSWERKQLFLRNATTKSLFKGYATGPHVQRGARRRGILYDEYAAVAPDVAAATLATTQHIGTRIWCSTPMGPSGAFADVAHDTRIRRIDLDWSEHPQKNPGLYTTNKGMLQLLDPNPDFEVVDFRVPDYQSTDGTVKDWPSGQRGFPPDYKFVLDDKRRSPYYDGECLRTPIPQQIAQELDRDFLRSGAQFFDQSVLDKAGLACRPPEFIGEFLYDHEAGSLPVDAEGKKTDPRTPIPNGHLRLWANIKEPYAGTAPRDITSGTIPEDGEYVLGVDVSFGTGASNSVISIVDALTGEQIGEYASPSMPPQELAPLVRALGMWLNEAFVIWDAIGPGGIFRDALLKLGYARFHRRTADATLKKKVSDNPGFYGNRDAKLTTLGMFQLGIADKSLTTYSQLMLNEAGEYIHTATGSVEHSGVSGNTDPSGARDGHGDRVMALAMAWYACPRASAVAPKAKQVAQPGSLAHWREEVALEASREGQWPLRIRS